MTISKARKERNKRLREGKALEEKLGWAPGTLSNEDGWPPLYKPLTKRELAKREKERLERQAAMAAAEKAERDQNALDLAEALEDWLHQPPTVELGSSIWTALSEAGFECYKRNDYNEWD